MANPVLNDRAFQQAGRTDAAPGWGAPAASTTYIPPINDGPISRHRTGVMTIGGATTAAGVLFAILLVTATIGWNQVKVTGNQIKFPSWSLLAVLAGFALVLVTSFKPKIAPYTAPIYAAAEGVFVGAISAAYNASYHGIVLQAVGATAAVFAVMLVLYKTRIIKVTERFRRIVIGATMGVMVFYGISLLFSLFGHTPSFFSHGGPLGILVSVLVSGLAAFNLALDFDIIERGAASGAPKYMEWFAALGLMVTLVWLYLELLRLLSKLQSRR
jgi:uncharacterized YccA/Bax inhibitor family protein